MNDLFRALLISSAITLGLIFLWQWYPLISLTIGTLLVMGAIGFYFIPWC